MNTTKISYLHIGGAHASVSHTQLKVPQPVCVTVGPLLLSMSADEADELGRALVSHAHLSRVSGMAAASKARAYMDRAMPAAELVG